MDQFPPFPGFRAEGLAFLADLKKNNERDWFKARKQTFDDELIWPLRCLVADLSRQFAGSGVPLRGEPSKSIFRIYRDVRFSKNKDPYKTHVAAVLSRSGSKKESGGLYIHVEPGNSFVVAGFWQPEKELLRSWRDRMTEDPEDIRSVVKRLSGAGFELLEYGGKLKRLPRGFESVEADDIGSWLRHKSLLVQRAVDQEQLAQPGFTETVMDTLNDAMPLLEWGWAIQDDVRAA